MLCGVVLVVCLCVCDLFLLLPSVVAVECPSASGRCMLHTSTRVLACFNSTVVGRGAYLAFAR